MKRIVCPECKSPDIVRVGEIWSGRTKKQLFKCKSCGRQTVNPIVFEDRILSKGDALASQV